MTLRGQKPPERGYPKSLKTLGDHLRKKRMDLSLTQAEVAVRLGVTESSVWNWEHNASSPHLSYVARIAAFLGYDPLPPAETVAHQLVRYRTLRSITQRDMAGRLGVDPSTLARWERGEREPAGRHLKDVLRLTAHEGRFLSYKRTPSFFAAM